MGPGAQLGSSPTDATDEAGCAERTPHTLCRRELECLDELTAIHALAGKWHEVETGAGRTEEPHERPVAGILPSTLDERDHGLRHTCPARELPLRESASEPGGAHEFTGAHDMEKHISASVPAASHR